MLNLENEDYRQSHLRPNMGHIYDAWHESPYLQMVWRWEQATLIKIITKLSRETPRRKYLDFACGTGRILGLLEPYMGESYGVDLSDEMMRVAEQKVQKATLLKCDLTRESRFADHSFDVITAFRFFVNAQQQLREEVMAVLRRLVKKDGYFIFNVHLNQGCVLAKVLGAYEWLFRKKVPNFNQMSIAETRNLLHKENFEIVAMYHYGVVPVIHQDRNIMIKQLAPVEGYLSRLRVMLPLSQFIIYVCQLQQ